MATTITKASGSAGAMSVTLDIPMLTDGRYNNDTAWLDGGAAAGSYPGALAGFAAKNVNTTDPDTVQTRPLRLIMGVITLAVDGATFLIEGDATQFHAIVVGAGGVAATAIDAVISTVTNTGDTITIAAEGTVTGNTTYMAICS